ncbi:hypothetical protein L2E82_22967 [Cichorium intybus]|uniref:Uncharacterized protein n=1 Tax=Cichorium intybus TaxID=13427 RepID=A0ACB9DZF4_CICIN|nr:hypothetical protein L2E82_22967 [Cichorium intybus]
MKPTTTPRGFAALGTLDLVTHPVNLFILSEQTFFLSVGVCEGFWMDASPFMADGVFGGFVTIGLVKLGPYGEKKAGEGLEFEVYDQGMSKTELYNKWQETGAYPYPYGDNCHFAHGISELRPVIRHPRYKTEVCRMVLAGDICPYGHRCHFRHSLTDEEMLMAMNPR